MTILAAQTVAGSRARVARLAVSAPPYEFGALAMELALMRLADPNFVPAAESLTPSSLDISVRGAAIAKRGINLPPIYIEASRGAGHLYP